MVRGIASVVGLALVAVGCSGPEPTAGQIEGPGRSVEVVEARTLERAAASAAAGALPGKQVLFGDLHVHTTFSTDAFMYSLPMWATGEGARPPADACDFARYCAGLDFFSINDHAVGLNAELWDLTRESIRECNARAGDPDNPDLVAFVGWEWTQTGPTPETHFGHKNVIFPGLTDDELPARPITSLNTDGYSQPPAWLMHAAASAIDLAGYEPYANVLHYMADLAKQSACPAGVDTRELPADCTEVAETPAELFRKLDEWGLPVLVIPHGLAWGIHAPPGATLAAQLSAAQHDPSKQRLIEIMSGHGNSEEYRTYASYALDDTGQRICPEPTADYLPCCWRAGELARERCGDIAPDDCDARVAEARQLALEAGVSPHNVFPDTRAEDWLDCDQCRDCFKPAMTLRPAQTAQYGAALASYEGDEPVRYRWGFIASTDNHAARPGTGYKQYDRPIMTDARGLASLETDEAVRPRVTPEVIDPGRAQPVEANRGLELFDVERKASFMYPGGIVAVHADGRDRAAIWDALMRREVYGTSGPRMLLWFDLINGLGPDGRSPMGSVVTWNETPSFQVRAVGALRQKPGCPEDALTGLSPDRVAELCRDECYHPGDTRHRIEAIEIIRIRVQQRDGEPIAPLIEDPWKRFECPPSDDGCRFEFDDPEYPESEHDIVYYARALQEPTPAINAATLRTTFDAQGNAIATDPCHGGYRTPADDDCLAPVSERAWSSPIYLDH